MNNKGKTYKTIYQNSIYFIIIKTLLLLLQNIEINK
jgi:hypothetical protein